MRLEAYIMKLSKRMTRFTVGVKRMRACVLSVLGNPYLERFPNFWEVEAFEPALIIFDHSMPQLCTWFSQQVVLTFGSMKTYCHLLS